MKTDILNYINNLKINERKFFALSAGLVLTGSGILGTPSMDNICGITMLSFGIYSGLIAQEYRNMSDDIIECYQKEKKYRL